MARTRVALLLPLSGQQAPLGQALQQAAELALFAQNDPRVEFVPLDTAGTATGGMTTGVVQPVEVTLGGAVEGSVEVRAGLSPGDIVVVRGNERLRPGMAVSFRQPQRPQ
jgi:hypothetical protein